LLIYCFTVPVYHINNTEIKSETATEKSLSDNFTIFFDFTIERMSFIVYNIFRKSTDAKNAPHMPKKGGNTLAQL